MGIFIAVVIPVAMIVGWLIHIAVYWNWDFRAWYHDSDGDI